MMNKEGKYSVNQTNESTTSDDSISTPSFVQELTAHIFVTPLVPLLQPQPQLLHLRSRYFHPAFILLKLFSPLLRNPFRSSNLLLTLTLCPFPALKYLVEPVFPTVKSVRLWVGTGRTTAHSPSFFCGARTDYRGL